MVVKMEMKRKIKEILLRNVPEIIYFLGMFFIVYATFLIDYVIALYVLGAMLLGTSIIIARGMARKEKR